MSSHIDLKVKKATFVLDPDDFDVADIQMVPTAKPTEGPHRYTIYVPHDERARISIGKAHPNKGEDGVAIETASHIHLWTHDKETEGVATYLHLGKRSATTGYDVNQKGDGYALYTSGGSSHVAHKEVTVVSQEDSILISAHCDAAIVSHDAGVSISAKEHIMATALQNIELCAGQEEKIEFDGWDQVIGVGLLAFEVGDFLAPLGKHAGAAGESTGETAEAGAKTLSLFTGFVESNASKWKEKFIATHAKTASKVLKHAEAMSSLLLGFKKTMKKAKKAEHGWEKGLTWYSYGVDAAAKLVALANEFTAPKKEEEGKVKIKATNGVTIDTDKGVSIYAADSVSLAGFMGNSITGLGCSVKAYKDVSIWGGMGAAMKSLAGDVAMTTDFGEANVKGHKGVEVSSAEGDVKVTAEKDVQLNSIQAKALVHGEKGAYFGAGTGDGQGLILTKTKLEMGCVTDAEKFSGVKLDKDHGTVTITKIMAAIGNGPDNRLDIKKAGAQLKAAKLDVKTSGPIKINGATVNIN